MTVAVALAVLALVAARAPEAGEPLGLRWLRTCSDHPLRTLGALTLAVAALVPRRPSP